MENQLTLEERFAEIESLITKMESPEISLEDSFACYKAGMEQLAACNELMDQVEKKVQVLNGQGQLEDFTEV